jgi:hypothetical protein
VLQIDRVQNLRLYTKYLIRRNEVHVQMLFDKSPAMTAQNCEGLFPLAA